MIDISYKNLEEAHKHTICNREELEKSKFVFCISCRSFVHPSDITEFVDEGKTGICPYCDVDALIGDACGIRLTDKLLTDLHYKYFTANPTIKLTIDRQKDRQKDKSTDIDIEAAYTIISCEYDTDWWILKKPRRQSRMPCLSISREVTSGNGVRLRLTRKWISN